jgi:serine/threonine protein kinase
VRQVEGKQQSFIYSLQKTGLIELILIKNVLFIDFGISCIKQCVPGGTITHMAPELYRLVGLKSHEDIKRIKKQLLSDKKTELEGKTIPINKEDFMKTDIFSLGLVFYEITHNKFPYPFKTDYIQDKINYYKRNMFEFELDLSELEKTDIELYDRIMSYEKKDDENEMASEDQIEMKIRTYVENNLPSGLLSADQNVFAYYNYYKNNELAKSVYFEKESKNPNISKVINELIDKMLVISPLKRQSIHRLNSKFKKQLREASETSK